MMEDRIERWECILLEEDGWNSESEHPTVFAALQAAEDAIGQGPLNWSVTYDVDEGAVEITASPNHFYIPVIRGYIRRVQYLMDYQRVRQELDEHEKWLDEHRNELIERAKTAAMIDIQPEKDRLRAAWRELEHIAKTLQDVAARIESRLAADKEMVDE